MSKIKMFCLAFVTVFAAIFCMGALNTTSTVERTFFNGYEWTGNPAKDNAWQWAKDMENLVEAGMRVGTGQIFYVDSGSASGGNGLSWTYAKDTLDAAVALCTASRGDVILVAQGHAEDLAAADAVDLDVIGISVDGHGNGSLRPTFTYTAAAGEFVIGADNIAISNLRFLVSTDSVTTAIDIQDSVDYAYISGCQFLAEATTDEALNFINLVNNNTGCVIQNNTFDAKIGSAESAIMLDADTDQTVIANNVIQGDYSVACIEGDTALSTEVLIRGNLLVNGSSDSIIAQPAIDLLTGTTGYIINNQVVCNVATVAAAMETCDTVMIFGNSYNEDVGATKADLPWNAGGYGSTLIDSVSASGDG